MSENLTKRQRQKQRRHERLVTGPAEARPPALAGRTERRQRQAQLL